MAESTLRHEPATDNSPRWIVEPSFLVRLRRIKAVWHAFKFLARGGKFKVHLDFSGLDPRAITPVVLNVGCDRRVDVTELHRQAVQGARQKLSQGAGLLLAQPGEPGAFMVKWSTHAHAREWKERGFNVAQLPDELVVSQKEVANG